MIEKKEMRMKKKMKKREREKNSPLKVSAYMFIKSFFFFLNFKSYRFLNKQETSSGKVAEALKLISSSHKFKS